MLYEIRYEDIVSVRKEIVEYSQKIKTQMEELNKSYSSLLDAKSVEGETAETLSTYISTIHGSIMSLVLAMLEEYTNKLLVYENGLHEIEGNRNAIMYEAELSLLSKGLGKGKKKYGDITNDVSTILQSVNEFYYHSEPSTTAVNDAYKKTAKIADELKKEVGQYEYAHRNDCEQLKQYIVKINQFITSQTKGPDETISIQKIQEVLAGEDIQELAKMQQETYGFSESHQVELGKEYDLINTELEEERARARVLSGTLKVLTGVVMVGTIIATGGAATPLVVAFEAAEVTYAAAETWEGLQDIHGGLNGDGSSKSYNFIRDGVIGHFTDEETAQAIYEVLGISLTITSGGISELAKQGIKVTTKNLAEATAKEGIKTLIATGAGYTTGKIADQLGVNEGGRQLLSMLAGIATTYALGKVDGLKVNPTGSGYSRNSLDAVLKEEGLDRYQFNKLRLTKVEDLTSAQVEQLKRIREAVPKIDANTMIQKTIPEGDIDKYLGDSGYDSIGGYIAKYDDVSHLNSYNDVVESSRLDYLTDDGIRPYPEGGDTYGYIKFKTEDVDKINIPYGKIFGGENKDKPPCTLNGYTGARNGEIIPEWTCSGELIKPNVGAELHKVVAGKDTVIAIYDGEHFR